jgi:hypothetical protein
MRRDFSVDRLHGGLLATALVIMFIGLAPAGVARITKIVLNLPTSPYRIMSFGSVGQYAEIDGIAYGEVDPNDPLSSVIQDMTNRTAVLEYGPTEILPSRWIGLRS